MLGCTEEGDLSKVMQDFPKTEGMFWAIYTTVYKEY